MSRIFTSSNGARIKSAQTELNLVGNTTDTGTLKLYELSSNGQEQISLKAPDALASDYTLTFPIDDGSVDQVLKTDGSGTLSWTDSTSANINVADESSDTSCNVLFVTGPTGDLPPKSGSNLTFNSSSGLLTASLLAGDLTGDVTGALTGNADTATKLAAAKTIGGVAFDGSTNIDLPGVNAEGDQDTTGLAATATILATTRTIGGVSFNGSTNIDLPGVNAEGDQDTTGNATTATTLEDARTIGGVSFNGSANINLPGVNGAGNQDTSGLAATATILATTRTIGGVSFNGSANISLPGVNGAGNQDTTGNAATATLATNVTITDNESTNENNAIIFTAGGDVDGGNLGLESDGTLTYNPSSGLLTATGFAGLVGTASQGSINHDSLLNFVADEHIDHSSVSVIAGTGLSGGGTITTNRTLNIDISEYSDVNPTNGDKLLTLDSDGATEQLSTIASLATLFSGTNLTASNSVISVDDAFLKNNADDTTSGTITSGGFTTTGTWTFDDANSGVVGITTIHTGDGFVDNDTSLMTAGAIKEKIEDYGYTTNVGDITGVTAGTGLTGGGTSGTVTLNVIGGDGITANANNMAITPAQTTITSIYNAGLKVGRDSQNLIDFATDNKIIFKVNNIPELELVPNYFSPVTNDGIALGTASKMWSDLYLADGAKIKFKDGSGEVSMTHTSANILDIASEYGSEVCHLRVDGDITAYYSSDKRLKTNIKKIENPLDKLSKINGYTFTWNELGKEKTNNIGDDIGVIAQEIEKILPEITTIRTNGYKAVRYEKIVPLLIECIKEQQIQIDKLNVIVNSMI